MSKKINKIAQELSNNELCEAVKEIQDWHKKGVLSEGHVRKVSSSIKEILPPMSTGECLDIAESSILNEAAMRFMSLVEKGELNG